MSDLRSSIRQGVDRVRQTEEQEGAERNKEAGLAVLHQILRNSVTPMYEEWIALAREEMGLEFTTYGQEARSVSYILAVGTKDMSGPTATPDGYATYFAVAIGPYEKEARLSSAVAGADLPTLRIDLPAKVNEIRDAFGRWVSHVAEYWKYWKAHKK